MYCYSYADDHEFPLSDAQSEDDATQAMLVSQCVQLNRACTLQSSKFAFTFILTGKVSDIGTIIFKYMRIYMTHAGYVISRQYGWTILWTVHSIRFV